MHLTREVQLTGCLFTDNEAPSGSIAWAGPHTNLSADFCTFAANGSDGGSAQIVFGSSFGDLELANVILAGARAARDVSSAALTQAQTERVGSEIEENMAQAAHNLAKAGAAVGRVP